MSTPQEKTIDLSVLQDPSVQLLQSDGKVAIIFKADEWIKAHGFSASDHLFIKAMLTKLFEALHETFAKQCPRGMFAHTWTIDRTGQQTAQIPASQFNLNELFEHLLHHAEAPRFKLSITEVKAEYKAGERVTERLVAEAGWCAGGDEVKFTPLGLSTLWIEVLWIHERREMAKLLAKIQDLSKSSDKTEYDAKMADIEDDLFVLYERK